MANTYRDELVAKVKATGKYIAEYADKIVDTADLKRDFSIYINFDAFDIPEISITQSHYMKHELDVELYKGGE